MKSDGSGVAVTGAAGFIGSNLVIRLKERGLEVHAITRETPADEAQQALTNAQAIFHLAGANRPADPHEFQRINVDYTRTLAEAVHEGGARPLIVYSSSAKASEPTDYGKSKRAAEDILLDLAKSDAATVVIDRLPNVFGKWSRPNYNSAVATFCYNCARGLPISIDNPAAPLTLLYIDDLIERWLGLLDDQTMESGMLPPAKAFETNVGAVAEQIEGFAAGRRAGAVEPVGRGLARALYATFVSFLPTEEFSYPLESHVDSRGTFTELLATRDSGQMSSLTAHPGVTRGQHYHHSKVERFVVVNGQARFRFRHLVSGETFEVMAAADSPKVVETIPGWTHDITNVGDDLLVALLWASEKFDPAKPDTVAMPL
jgi:UDP-2-acetamido-2,6-beta-L-arabino-hexul-4-ose reductase